MKRLLPIAALLLVVGAAVGTALAAPPRKPLSVKVGHTRVYLDTAGPGKGELLVRVFTRYGSSARSAARGRSSCPCLRRACTLLDVPRTHPRWHWTDVSAHG